MNARCKPGDLAVVVRAQNRVNLGNIVRVIEAHDGTGELAYPSRAGPVWLCECQKPMFWYFRNRVFVQNIGPIPDSCLQLLRGKASDDITDSLVRADSAEVTHAR